MMMMATDQLKPVTPDVTIRREKRTDHKNLAAHIRRRAVLRRGTPAVVEPGKERKPFNIWALIRQILYWGAGLFLLVEPYRYLTRLTNDFADDALFRKDNQHPVLVQIVAWLVLFPVGLAFWIIDFLIDLIAVLGMLSVYLIFHTARLFILRFSPAAVVAIWLIGASWFQPAGYATFSDWQAVILAPHPADLEIKPDIRLRKYRLLE